MSVSDRGDADGAARYDFASDNTAGMSPEALRSIQEANRGFLPSYGEDGHTARAADRFRELFETDCEVFFVFNGTAANALALSSLCQSYHSVIAAETAHIETDECGAPEFFSNGTKLLVAPAADGRLGRDALVHLVRRRGDIHYPKPRAVSLSQATELGTVYRPGEIGDLAGAARGLGLLVHMDGARFANAVFLALPDAAHRALARAGWRYYRFIGGGARFMCTWQTRPEAVDELAGAIGAALEEGGCAS